MPTARGSGQVFDTPYALFRDDGGAWIPMMRLRRVRKSFLISKTSTIEIEYPGFEGVNSFLDYRDARILLIYLQLNEIQPYGSYSEAC